MEAELLVRDGGFSSSQMHKLVTRAKDGIKFGAPALKYIQEVKWEKKLGRPLENEKTAKPTSWGNLVEKRAFDLLPMD